MIKKFQFGKKLPTAPDAKEVYKGGTYKSGKIINSVTVPFEPDMILRKIEQKINPITNDTTYVEYPSHTLEVRSKKRKASSSDKDRTEYETLNRRFNEAVSVSKKQQGGQMQQ